MKAREKAYDILEKVCLDNGYANLLMRKELNDFNELDKRLITNIVYGTLKNSILLDTIIDNYCDNKLNIKIRILLRMSIYQLKYMDKSPEYAIVNDSVDIAKNIKGGSFVKLVNAVLRNYVRNPYNIELEENINNIDIITSHPKWLVKMWSKQYGEDIAINICKENLNTPLTSGRVNTLNISTESFMSKYVDFKSGNVKDSVVYDLGNIASSEAYINGDVVIQDEASQMVALFLNPSENEYILDACSAPGTKASHIASLMNNTGKIIAGDLHEHRVNLINESIKRLNITNIETRQLDASKLDEIFNEDTFDKILLDVPCSGYGVLGRKPDLKYHLNGNDMDEIIKLQEDILNAASKLIKINKEIVYSTCTLNKKENDNQIRKFLEYHNNFELIEEKTVFPYEINSDGFYMAKIKRIS